MRDRMADCEELIMVRSRFVSLRMLATAFLAAVLSVAAQAGELVDKTDRFTQKRELKWISHVRSEKSSEMGLTASVYFHVNERPSRVLMHLAGSFGALKYVDCHVTDWLADGARVKPELNTHQVLPRNDSPRSIEIITSVFTVSQLKQLADAQLIEYRVCRDEGRVVADDHAGLRELVSRLGP